MMPMQGNEREIPWKDIIKHFSGSKDSHSKEQLDQWLNSECNQKTFDELKALWEYCKNTQPLLEFDAHKRWQTIEQKLRQPETKETKTRKKGKRRPLSWALLVAILMALLIFWMLR